MRKRVVKKLKRIGISHSEAARRCSLAYPTYQRHVLKSADPRLIVVARIVAASGGEISYEDFLSDAQRKNLRELDGAFSQESV